MKRGVRLQMTGKTGKKDEVYVEKKRKKRII